MKSSRGILAFSAIFIFILVVILVGIYVKRHAVIDGLPQNKIVQSPLASAVGTPKATSSSSTSATWKTYTLTIDQKNSVSVRYQLPITVAAPAWANAGQYYVETLLPGHSMLAIIPITPDNMQPQPNFEGMVSNLVKKNNWRSRPTTLLNRPAIGVEGTLTPAASPQLNLLGDGTGEFQAIFVKINDQDGLELVLYQDTVVKEAMNFKADQVLFSEIATRFSLASRIYN